MVVTAYLLRFYQKKAQAAQDEEALARMTETPEGEQLAATNDE
jgi:hypothetical protein